MVSLGAGRGCLGLVCRGRFVVGGVLERRRRRGAGHSPPQSDSSTGLSIYRWTAAAGTPGRLIWSATIDDRRMGRR